MRSADNDPVEIFRFDVRIISVSLSPVSLVNSAIRGSIEEFARVGFTSVTTPEFTTNTMRYRENTDNFVFRKIPGLMEFSPITMSRGVASSKKSGQTKDFYRWVTRVNSPNPSLSLINEINGGNQSNNILRQSENFRKDMIIILRDREGKAVKRWYVINAFPTNYKGSTDLDSLTEEKAIESITLDYELAFELPSIADAAQEFIASIVGDSATDILGDLDLGF